MVMPSTFSVEPGFGNLSTNMASCPMISVYISSCGSHVAILLSGSKILVKPYFKDDYADLIPSEWGIFEFDLSPFDRTYETRYRLHACHLAFDNGRIAVAMV